MIPMKEFSEQNLMQYLKAFVHKNSFLLPRGISGGNPTETKTASGKIREQLKKFKKKIEEILEKIPERTENPLQVLI